MDLNGDPEPLLQCRACSEMGAEYELVSLFGGIGQLARIYAVCTGLACVADDGLPGFLCAGCNAKLIGLNKFRQRCAQFDAGFRARLPPQTQPTSQVVDDEVQPEPKHEEAASDLALSVRPNMERRVDDDDMLATSDGFHVEVLRDQYDMDSQDMISVKSMPDDEYTEDCPAEDSTDPVDDNTIIEFILTEPVETSSAKQNYISGVSSSSRHPQTDMLTRVVYQCDICASRFYKKPRLEKHMRDRHSDVADEKTFVCDTDGCSKTFRTTIAMSMHRRKMHPQPPKDASAPLRQPATTTADSGDAPLESRFVCDQCGKYFQSNGALKKHSFTHTGQYPFACTYCPNRYVTRHKLKEHTMRHEGVRNHVCPYCGMRKTTMHELKVHINYHTRETVWQCDKCPMRFTSPGNLSRHVRIVHKGIKAFTCTTCDRSFGKAETLKHHVMTHTGERPHACDLCDKRFIQLVALQTHRRTHLKLPKGCVLTNDEQSSATAAEPEQHSLGKIITLKVERSEVDPSQ